MLKRAMKVTVFIILSSLFFLTLPATLSFGYNEYIRLTFEAAVYRKIQEALPHHYRLYARESQVSSAGIGDNCVYSATFVIQSYAGNSGEILAQLRKMDIPTARNAVIPDVEIYAEHFSSFYTIIATDGPYDPLFDIRCY